MLKTSHFFFFCAEAVVIELEGTWRPPSHGLTHIVSEGVTQITKGEKKSIVLSNYRSYKP